MHDWDLHTVKKIQRARQEMSGAPPMIRCLDAGRHLYQLDRGREIRRRVPARAAGEWLPVILSRAHSTEEYEKTMQNIIEQSMHLQSRLQFAVHTHASLGDR